MSEIDNEWGIKGEQSVFDDAKKTIDKVQSEEYLDTMPSHEVTVDISEPNSETFENDMSDAGEYYEEGLVDNIDNGEYYEDSPEGVEYYEDEGSGEYEAADSEYYEDEEYYEGGEEYVDNPGAEPEHVIPVSVPVSKANGKGEKSGDSGNNGKKKKSDDDDEDKDQKVFTVFSIVALATIAVIGIVILIAINVKNKKNDDRDINNQIVDVEEDNNNWSFASGNSNTQNSGVTGSGSVASDDSDSKGEDNNSPDTVTNDENSNKSECDINGHTWVNATCDKPRTCSVCGTTEGEALGHTWTEATCEDPKTCSVCGATEGKALGHDWSEATCTEAATCERCGKTAMAATGHSWTAATCEKPKTCSICGATEGQPEGHKYTQTAQTVVGNTKTTTYTCSVCGDTKVETEEIQSSLDYEQQVIQLVNEQRAAAGLPALTMSTELMNTADLRAQEIVVMFDHVRPDGTSCFTAFDACGVTGLTRGENIAAGQTSPSAVMSSWMGSSGHKDNILDPDFTKIGVGYYSAPNDPYKYYWVQVFSN